MRNFLRQILLIAGPILLERLARPRVKDSASGKVIPE